MDYDETKAASRCACAFLTQYDPPRYVFSVDGWYGRGSTWWHVCSPAEMESVAVQALLKDTKAATKMDVADFLATLRGVLWVPDSGVFFQPDGGGLKTSDATGWLATRSHYVHMETGETRADDGSLFTLGCVPCAFDPDAACPRWERFVADACPDDRETLRAMFGLSLTYDRRFNVFFVVHGEPGTGKSTALAVLAALNAGTVCGVSLGAFGERFQTYPLTTHRLNLVQDMDSVFEGSGSVSLREAVLKSLTCGEKIQVEQKHVAPEYRRLTALSVFGCNTLPRFADRSGAIADRLRIIGFPNVFRGSGREVLNLSDVLIREELPGILNWSMSGYRDLLASGIKRFPETPASAVAKAALIKSTRPEELFFDEAIVATDNPLDSVSTLNVFDRYDNWCRFRKYNAIAENKFSERLLKYFPTVTKCRKQEKGSRHVCYLGLKLLPCNDSLIQD